MSLHISSPTRVGGVRAVLIALVAVVSALAVALLVAVQPQANAAGGKHAAVYYQTQYDGDRYVSPLELTGNGAPVTDVLVGAFHLNSPEEVRLNDDPPDAAKFDQMWSDLGSLQGQGVQVLGMIGGAAQGSFQRLDTEFDTYYPVLKNIISTYELDGVDLDVEEDMSQEGIERLVTSLRADFGPDFQITLAPVASALSGGGNLSGFDYEELYRNVGGDISWFNAQFYNGWGDASSTADYDAIIDRGVIPADKVSLGVLTNSGNGGSGYVDVAGLRSTLTALKDKYTDFGGATGWEYFNAESADGSGPWQWVTDVASAWS